MMAAAANHLYLAAAAAHRARFERAARDPGAVQRRILRDLLRANRDTAFGREHGFAEIRTPEDFRARVPVRDFEGMRPYVERIAAGEEGVLTREPVSFVEPSGGTSGPSKLVPYTPSLLREFSAATMPWVFDLLWSRPALRRGRAYWAVSPPGRRPERTEGGVRIGMEHDSDYFPRPVRAVLDRVIGVPRAVSRAPDMASCRYLTLLALLGMPDLAMASVWNPSFLTLLAAALDEHWERLLRDLERGGCGVPLPASMRAEIAPHFPARPARAARLRARFGLAPPEDLGRVWERLALISCWTDGHARRALAGMRRRFPEVPVQGKGLLATEGVVSFPLFAAGGPVAAVASHFLEFIPEAGGEPRVAHEVEEGRTYEVALTTGGGLVRYRLRDLVRVDGWHHRAPVLAFAGRADRTSDLAGEKLTAPFAERVLSAAEARTGIRAPFAMLAPSWGAPPHYLLFAETDRSSAALLAAEAERGLAESHPYALCRALGQLGPVRGVAVAGGERAYERACARRGQRAGAVKPAALDPGLEWEAEFGGAHPEA
jgi:hypothetical protein